MPKVETLREKYLPILNEKAVSELKEAILNQDIAVLSDETRRGRCVYAVLFATVSPTKKQLVSLASVSFLDNANATTCSNAILDTLREYGVQNQQVRFLVSDSAPYMIACGKALKILIGPHLLHITCWGHKINNVGEQWQETLADLNSFVTKMKAIFLLSRKTRAKYRKFLSTHPSGITVKLFPIPVLTRWNSWFNSVEYISDYFDPIYDFLLTHKKGSATVSSALKLVSNAEDRAAIKSAALFTKEQAAALISLIDKYQQNSKPNAHTIWVELSSLKSTLESVKVGIISESVHSIFPPEESLQCLQLKLSMQDCATADLSKLNKYMNSPKEAALTGYLDTLSKLFDPSRAKPGELNDIEILQLLRKISNFESIPNLELSSAYRVFLHRLEMARLTDAERPVDILSLLQSSPHSQFASRAISSLWAPVANADSERFFSKYSLVVSDRRLNMKESSVVTNCMLYFNSSLCE